MIAPLRDVVASAVELVPSGPGVAALLVRHDDLDCGHRLPHDPPATALRARRRCPACARVARRTVTEAWKEARRGR